MTDNAAHAAELVQLAREKSAVLQVGHVERFNPVLKYLEQVATDPRFIETTRLSPYPKRSTDIGVVLDLMIHDLDVVLGFVRSPVASVDAVGIPVLSQSEDIANARLRFANGCVANLTASRVSPEQMRKIRVFSGGADDQLCFAGLPAAGRLHLPRRARGGGGVVPAQKAPARQRLRHRQRIRRAAKSCANRCRSKKDEPLKLELQDFIRCVQAHLTPKVSGAAAKRALDLAFEITRQIQAAKNGPVTSDGRPASHRPDTGLRSLARLHHGPAAGAPLAGAQRMAPPRRCGRRRPAPGGLADLLRPIWQWPRHALKGFPIPSFFHLEDKTWTRTRCRRRALCRRRGGFSHRSGRPVHSLQNRRVPEKSESGAEMKPKTIMVVAGDPSGDANAAALVRALAAAAARRALHRRGRTQDGRSGRWFVIQLDC